MTKGIAGVGRICVSLAESNVELLGKKTSLFPKKADIIEIRLDAMDAPDVGSCYDALPGPLLFTNRPVWEGGLSRQSDTERAAILLKAIELKAAYVDWELAAEQSERKKLLDCMNGSATQMILSSHDFTGTPPIEQLRDTVLQMQDSGAHIGKIVTTANSITDVLRILSLQELAAEYNFPLCAFCMGETGRISRFATLYLGGYMSYVAADESSATAPGQISFKNILKAIGALQPST